MTASPRSLSTRVNLRYRSYAPPMRCSGRGWALMASVLAARIQTPRPGSTGRKARPHAGRFTPPPVEV